MYMPLISVLMVNYNHENTLYETIESVLTQTYQNIQFIIVDDGSTDDSCKIIEAFKDERIEFYKFEKNRHICHVTNFGIKKVKGEYLAKIDSDDLWYSERLETQMRFLKMHPEYRICFSLVDIIDSEGKRLKNSILETMYTTAFTTREEYLREFFFRGNFLAHSSVLMETELMREIGECNLGYAQSQDFDYWVRIVKKYPIYVVQEKLVAVRRFNANDKIENISATSEIPTTRFYNEYMDIRGHMFEDVDDELFYATFRKYFKCKTSFSREELECEKAFLQCTPCPPSSSIPPAGIRSLLSLFQDEKYVSLLQTKYNFTVKDFYQMTGTHLYYDRIIEDRISGLQNDNQQLAERGNQLENMKNEMEGVIESLRQSLQNLQIELEQKVQQEQYLQIELQKRMQNEQNLIAELDQKMQSERDLKMEVDQYRICSAQLEEKLSVETQQYQRKIEDYENSTCWRITKPLRLIMDRMKGL